MLISEFSDRTVSGKIYCENGVYLVAGKLHLGFRDANVLFRAAEPNDMRLSISGSGLPFPNPEMAYGPVNSGQAQVDRYGNFEFKVFSPNSYYKNDDIMNGVGQGKILALPHIHLTVTLANGTKKGYDFPLDQGKVGLRSLTGLPNKMVRSTSRNTPSYYV